MGALMGWDMLAKQMERMAIAAIRDRRTPIKWIITEEALKALRIIAERFGDDIDAPKLADIDPPAFMGIPIEVGEPSSTYPAVDLVTECDAANGIAA